MPICRVQVRIPKDTAVPADVVVNTWAVDLDNATSLGLVNFQSALTTFYNALSSYRSTAYDWANTVMRAYNMEDDEPREPFYDFAMGLNSTASGTPLPPEVAICLSFQGASGSGFNMARRRGRVYLGPLQTGVLDTVGNVASVVRTTITNAADTLLTASGSGDWQWGVISLAGIGVGFTPVTNGWVDGAFDIQRRRGVQPSVRTTFS